MLACLLGFLSCLAGCAGRDSADDQRPKYFNQVAEIVQQTSISIHGRAFSLELLESSVDGVRFKTLQVTGDGVVVGVGSVATEGQPKVDGGRIHFGGQTLEILETANHFKLDGVAHELAPGRIYSFWRGQLRPTGL